VVRQLSPNQFVAGSNPVTFAEYADVIEKEVDVFELWSYNHDGYTREHHINLKDFAHAVEEAIEWAADGDHKYNIHMRVTFNGETLFTVDHKGAKMLLDSYKE
jgi:hypothetical protein